MEKFKQIPKKKQGMKLGSYIKHATYKELTILFASYFWSDIQFKYSLDRNSTLTYVRC